MIKAIKDRFTKILDDMDEERAASNLNFRHEIKIHTKEILSTKKRLNEIYSKHTGQTVETIKEALERDNFMSADEAKKFGLVDKVVVKREN